MSDSTITRNFLALHGHALIDQGYTVVPIQQGKKAPGFDGWQHAKPSKSTVDSWLDSGFKNAGVGILTKYTCAIDIDCMDEAAALHFERRCIELIGKAPVRIGRAPKRLLLYRTTEPFRKRRSKVYRDEWGDKQLIEVLGDGQQFVAFHIHPDTGKPYTWVGDVSPLTVRASDLQEVSMDAIETLIAEFETHAESSGWEVVKADRKAPSASGKIDHDNPFIEDSHAVEISDEELRSRLLMVPGSDDYDLWFQVGMALYHQYDGDRTGFDLWNEWSETADNYDPDALERHWPTFGIQGKKRAPLTARFILRLSKEAVEKTAQELSIKLRDAFINAKDLTEWEKARQMAREAEIDGLSRSTLAMIAKDRRDSITGTRTSLVEIRKAISYLPKKNDKIPSWAENWVYDVSDDKFYHLERKIATSKQGFDAMFDRYALTKQDILNGAQTPTRSASDLCLTMYRIPTVDGRRYMPGRDSVFHEADGTFANTYPEHEIPAKPEVDLPRDKRNVERVRAHIAHLLPDEREQRMFLDWLSWIVQNPGKHANYAILLQGVEGDGKSFFAELMRTVMGVSNVTMVNANTLIKFHFTNWAYGQCLCCVEEIRIVSTKGQDKWEAINKMKPYITNNVIEVRPLGAASFNAINTTSYLLFSNYQDALPLDDDGRRYLVLFSQWQRRAELLKFKEANPTYYTKLYATLNESAGALRQWLLDHQQEEGFNPLGDAPFTAAKKTMIRKSKPEFILALDEIIEENETPEISHELLDVTVLSDMLSMRGLDVPGPKVMSAMLERDGYSGIGKVRLGEGVIHTFYTRVPHVFTSTGAKGVVTTDAWQVREFLGQRRKLIAESL